MANIANVKVKAGNVLELSGSAVSISGSQGLTLHTQNGGIDANAGTGPITLDAGYVSVNAGAGLVDITGSVVNLSGSATVAQNLSVTGDITGSNLLLTGEIIAQKLSIVETTVSSSVLYSSGSTKFGNTPGDGPGPEDTHQFSGSVYITGSTVTLTGGSFSGNGSGLTEVTASAIATADNNSATAGYVVFTDGTGVQIPLTDVGLRYDAVNNHLTASVFKGDLAGNADTATALETARSINGTSFDGTANITTDTWGTARDITIGGTTRSVNGSTTYTWTLDDIGAAGTGSNNTFTGTNTFSNTNNQFTGSFSGSGANITALNADNISAGTLAIARGGTNNTSFTDVHQGAGGEVFLVAQSGSAGNEKLQSIALTGSAGIIVGFDGTKVTLDVGGSVGTGTVTEVNSGNGLSGGPITSTGTLSVSASVAGGIQVDATDGVHVNDSIVLTTTGTGPYSMVAAVSSSIGFSGSVGLFGSLTVGSADVAGTLGVGSIAADDPNGANTFAGEVSIDRSLKLNVTNHSAGTLQTNDDIVILAASGTTIELPTTPAEGQYYVVKTTDELSTGVTVNGNGKNVDGSATYVMYGPYQSITLVYSGTAWFVL